MYRFLFIYLGCLLCSTLLYANNVWTLVTPSRDSFVTKLIPYPEKVLRDQETIEFKMLNVDNASLSKIDCSKFISDEVKDVCLFWNMSNQGTSICKIFFSNVNGDKQKNSEGYYLNISKEGIKISASCYAGFFNAIQTLRQLIYKDQAYSYKLPCCVIEDNPSYSMRGIMLDVGRNYVSIPFIKEIMRKLSYYKINVLHLHLTDDPGWRIEIKKYPQLTNFDSYWKTRQPGKYYTQDELISLVDYCKSINVRVIPEIDMPGHSAYFQRAFGVKMQTPKGIEILQSVLDEVIPIFEDSLFHIGSDEVSFQMDSFMPTMIDYIRSKKKRVVSWFPGYSTTNQVIKMCWGENELGATIDKTSQYIDCNGFYMDWMSSQGGVLQTFFQQPCEQAKGDSLALGSIMCVWTDAALESEKRLLEQYPFYPCMITFAERLWRGCNEKRKDLMAQFPSYGTDEWLAITEFEERLIYHRDKYFQHIPFPYVKQGNIKWNLIGPFRHHGINNKSFEPEQKIKKEYLVEGESIQWLPEPVYGGEIQIRNIYSVFNSHNGKYRLEHWPTKMSSRVGKDGGTCYALTYIKSPKPQNVYLMFGLNGMWGHSGGYRTARAPEQGQWDFSGGDIWLNDKRIYPPIWPFESLPWTGWGQGRIEIPLSKEGYFYRPPVQIHLEKGLNKILIRSVFGHWKGDYGQRKWQFCCIPVAWDGVHYSEVEGLEYINWIN